MKSSLLTLMIACLSLLANAQSKTFKPFKVDLAVGAALPNSTQANSSLILDIEPKYAVTDALALGIRLGNVYSFESGSIYSLNHSFLATSDYYFRRRNVRPFVGAGAGIFVIRYPLIVYTVEGDIIYDAKIEERTASKFGFTPRAGIETGHFRTSIEANFVSKLYDFKNNYVGIKAGFFLGGGRR